MLRSVVLKSLVARSDARSGEHCRHVCAGATEDLVGCLAIEGGVRHDGVVLLDEEGDELAHGCDGVEGVQVEPLVLNTTAAVFLASRRVFAIKGA